MRLTRTRAEDAPFLVDQTSPLLLHIIEDAAVVTIDWPSRLVTIWHHLTQNVLRLNGLPAADKKSKNSSVFVSNTVNFIRCVWNFKQGIIAPSPAQHTSPKTWKHMIGKLVWLAMLNRPLLTCTQRFFSVDQSTRPLFINQPIASKRELNILSVLTPFAHVDVNLPLSYVIVAFDASHLRRTSIGICSTSSR